MFENFGADKVQVDLQSRYTSCASGNFKKPNIVCDIGETLCHTYSKIDWGGYEPDTVQHI